MEIRVLKSLATCALYPALERRRSGSGTHDGLHEPNGAEFPDEMADTVLNVPKEGNSFFSIGFDFALAVAAAIIDPAHSPDPSVAIAKAKAHIAEVVREAA